MPADRNIVIDSREGYDQYEREYWEWVESIEREDSIVNPSFDDDIQEAMDS